MSAAAINPAPPQPAAGASATGASHAAARGQGRAAPPVLGVFETLLASLGEDQQATASGDPAATAGAPSGEAAAGGKAAPDAGKSDTGKTDASKTKDKADRDDKTAAGDATATAPAGAASPDTVGPVPPVLPATLAATPPLTGSAGAHGDDANDSDGGLATTAATPSDKVPGATAAAVHAAQLAARTEPDLEEGEDKTPLGALVSAAARAANGSAANAAAKVPADGTPSTPAAATVPQGPAAPTPTTAPPPPAPAVLQPALAATDPASPAAPTPATPDLPALAAASAATAASAQAAEGPQAPAVAQAPSAAPPAPTVAKDKGSAPKAAVRVDGARADAAPTGLAALTAKAADALQPTTGAASAPHGDGDTPSPEPESDAGQQGSANQVQGPADGGASTATATTSAGLIHAAAVAVRGAPQTVAALAAQIVRKLDGRASRFDVQLDPAGLGKVDVRIAIGADGRMSAAMSFDTPQAAAELRARAGELHDAMAQAGFDLTGGMSFDVAGDRGQGGQAQNPPEGGAAWRGRAFQAALDTADPAPAPQLNLRRTASAGVDIRI